MGQFVSQSKTLRGCYRLSKVEYHFFRWFKFTLKPPYSIARGKLFVSVDLDLDLRVTVSKCGAIQYEQLGWTVQPLKSAKLKKALSK